jgi:hypothetical protein
MARKIHGFWDNLGDAFRGISSATTDLKEGIRAGSKQLRNDLKDNISDSSPRLGKAIDNIDRAGQALGNIIRRNPIPKPTTTVPSTDLLQAIKSLNTHVAKPNSDIPPASHLMVERLGYEHHALALYDGRVIHYSEGSIRTGSLAEFQGDAYKVHIVNTVCLYSPDMVIDRAYSRLAEMRYNVALNNCEHFVNWCRNGSETGAGI